MFETPAAVARASDQLGGDLSPLIQPKALSQCRAFCGPPGPILTRHWLRADEFEVVQ
jgi:hypothetical protein